MEIPFPRKPHFELLPFRGRLKGKRFEHRQIHFGLPMRVSGQNGNPCSLNVEGNQPKTLKDDPRDHTNPCDQRMRQGITPPAPSWMRSRIQSASCRCRVLSRMNGRRPFSRLFCCMCRVFCFLGMLFVFPFVGCSCSGAVSWFLSWLNPCKGRSFFFFWAWLTYRLTPAAQKNILQAGRDIQQKPARVCQSSVAQWIPSSFIFLDVFLVMWVSPQAQSAQKGCQLFVSPGKSTGHRRGCVEQKETPRCRCQIEGTPKAGCFNR